MDLLTVGVDCLRRSPNCNQKWIARRRRTFIVLSGNGHVIYGSRIQRYRNEPDGEVQHPRLLNSGDDHSGQRITSGFRCNLDGGNHGRKIWHTIDWFTRILSVRGQVKLPTHSLNILNFVMSVIARDIVKQFFYRLIYVSATKSIMIFYHKDYYQQQQQEQ